MNSIVLQFANGNVFFPGLLLTIIFACWRSTSSRVIKFFQSIFWLIGAGLVILSATPLPIWVYVVWLGACLGTVFRKKILFPRWLQGCIFTIFLAATIVMFFVELSHRMSPAILFSSNQSIYVIGDSISAGISEKERTWPSVLADLSKQKVINLARPGASVKSALKQAEAVIDTDALIFVEIGGNDLLGNTDARTFFAELDQLLGKLQTNNSRVVMFELPLFPFRNAFGQAQRNLAQKHQIILLPKNYLTKVFGLKNGTVDGLHLSQDGSEALAQLVFESMRRDN